MADELRIALTELLRKAGAGDAEFLREGVRALAQALMELEVTQQVGAERYERALTRTGQRNGYREREWDTRVGTIELQVPRVRDGSFFPSLLEPRKRAERALVAVVQEAYVQGVSTRRVDDLVQALGMQGISKSQVSRVRQEGRVVSMALVLAVGVKATGEREVLGLDLGPSEDGAFWLQFLRGLVARGLSGVQLVVSDAHEGLKGAIAAVLAGASWQRCRVHFLRNVLARVPRGSAEMVAAAIRTIFAQPTGQEVVDQVDKVAAMLAPKFPAVATMLADAREELTAFAVFPAAHWTKIWSTNPLERVNKEVKRRTNVVGI